MKTFINVIAFCFISVLLSCSVGALQSCFHGAIRTQVIYIGGVIAGSLLTILAQKLFMEEQCQN